MVAYARKVNIQEEFAGKRFPDNAILCNGCNKNLADADANESGTGFVIYVDKKHLESDRAHDIFCEDCLNSGFPKAKIV